MHVTPELGVVLFLVGGSQGGTRMNKREPKIDRYYIYIYTYMYIYKRVNPLLVAVVPQSFPYAPLSPAVSVEAKLYGYINTHTHTY